MRDGPSIGDWVFGVAGSAGTMILVALVPWRGVFVWCVEAADRLHLATVLGGLVMAAFIAIARQEWREKREVDAALKKERGKCRLR